MHLLDEYSCQTFSCEKYTGMQYLPYNAGSFTWLGCYKDSRIWRNGETYWPKNPSTRWAASRYLMCSIDYISLRWFLGSKVYLLNGFWSVMPWKLYIQISMKNHAIIISPNLRLCLLCLMAMSLQDWVQILTSTLCGVNSDSGLKLTRVTELSSHNNNMNMFLYGPDKCYLYDILSVLENLRNIFWLLLKCCYKYCQTLHVR